ncbi:uncharacterized protein LOC116540475 [Sapajus apella]|uniref:Uncharacterized protein LOC116540475 n=1 Tax=Sapajus apella TaxID=9515 RepID=A0A6J3GPT7_SAPAP|nr:uncharacterized protein LOC116540475 [Sapajus apella]
MEDSRAQRSGRGRRGYCALAAALLWPILLPLRVQSAPSLSAAGMFLRGAWSYVMACLSAKFLRPPPILWLQIHREELRRPAGAQCRCVPEPGTHLRAQGC